MLRYDLDLDIDYDASSFRGTVRISGAPAGRPMELDSVELDIESVSQAGTPVVFRLEPDREKLVLAIDPARTDPIEIRYRGTAGEGVQTGLFVSRLGERKALSTQMEPEGCRRFLPCFDRPDRKAEFRLVVAVRADLTVISNMPGARAPGPEGRAIWTFDRSPPLATYLLYLGVGPFEEARDDTEAPAIIFAGPPGTRARSRKGLADARASLRTLSEYFGLPYPLPKLHFVALSDFWVGMENRGAISGAESHYLIDGPVPPASLRFAEQTIVHETAHQWFGDLVTLEGWDDLWLNEAFATFITGRIQERAGIRQDAWGEFVLFTARGDPSDSLIATHPVRPDSVAAKEIMASADNITYFKGSRLIRMIESYLGEEPFRQGLSAYLARHRFGNARSADLWRALEESSGHGVVRVMQTWVERAGFPVIDVRQDGSDLELAQRRFTYLPAGATEPPWPIPLRVRTPRGEQRVLFDTTRLRLPGVDFRTAEIDPGRTGFYRILPAPELRRSVLDRLPRLAPLDRWGYLHDARAFLLSGDFSLADYLEVLRAARSASDMVTVEEVTQTVQILGPLLADLPGFRPEIREYLRFHSERLGDEPAPGEPDANGTMREWVARSRVIHDDEYARALSERWDRVGQVPVSMRPAVVLAAARFGTPERVAAIRKLIHAPEGEVSAQACWAAEGLPTGPDVSEFLAVGLGTARLSDLFVPLLVGASRNPQGRSVTWTWLTTNLRELERRAQGSYLMTYVLDLILPPLGLGREAEVRAFFGRESFPEGAIGIRTGLEMLRAVELLRARATGSGGAVRPA